MAGRFHLAAIVGLALAISMALTAVSQGQGKGGGGKPPKDDDNTPPAAVTDLIITEVTADSITLMWTATGDDGTTGTGTSYDIRYLAGEGITDENWDAADQEKDEPAPQVAGSSESFTVYLLPDTTYYLRLKVADEVPNFSDLSNEVSATTLTGPWSIEVVDREGNVGFSNSLAYDPVDGNPSIAYGRRASPPKGEGAQLQFAHWNGSSWDIEVVEPGPSGSGVNLAYDPIDGAPTIAYLASGDLKFARRSAASWEIETVDKRIALGVSLAYDLNENPSISYRKKAKGAWDLNFARWNGTGWDIEVVEAGALARYNNLTFDPSGNPAIAYSDISEGGTFYDTLKFAEWNPVTETWDIEILKTDTAKSVGRMDLEYDGAGKPTIVHRSKPCIAIVQRQADGTWTDEIVDCGTTNAFDANLEFDSTGTAFVAYDALMDTDHEDETRLATLGPLGWEIETVDRHGGFAGRISLVLDPDELPSFSHGEPDNGDLKFARKNP